MQEESSSLTVNESGTGDLGTCLAACDALPDCVAAVYTAHNNCWLHNSTADGYAKSERTVYYRQEANCTATQGILPSSPLLDLQQFGF